MQAATPGPGGASSIRRLEAKGNPRGHAEGPGRDRETAIFDTRANLITMASGGVVLTQGKNVLRGDRLKVEHDDRRVAGRSDSSKVKACSSREAAIGAAGGPGSRLAAPVQPATIPSGISQIRSATLKIIRPADLVEAEREPVSTRQAARR